MSGNDYTLVFEDRGSYLYAYLTGSHSFAAGLSYWNEIVDAAKKHGSRRVLIHEALEGSLTNTELSDLIQDVAPSGGGLHAAFFDENSANTEMNELAERLATSRGVDIRVFQTLHDAERWIRR